MTADRSGAPAAGLFWHERCFWHDPGAIGVFSAPGEFLQPQPASESPESKRRLKNLLEVSGLIDELAVRKPPPACREDLQRFHTPRYLEALEVGDRGRGGDGGDCAPYTPGSLAAARQSTGLAIAAVEAVATGELARAYALCRPPGHHAEADRGRGFCLLGNIPVAVMRARALGQVGRVAILDWDVHHGNGQHAAFYSDPEVFTVSIHQAGNYPLDTGMFEEQGEGAGKGACLNLPLPPGCGLGAYDHAMTELVLPAIEAFAP
ncbi:MAG: class II histone deacetylase, partial [Halomonas sp.]|uniref:class II histone deacetylase n=1 Tax=Halomonas sp. TaxID=1486246 RepID=UPI00286FD530